MIAKVCGLTTAAEVIMVLASDADLVGFLHHPPSPRHCQDLALARLARDRAVLVTVAPDGAVLMERLGQAQAGWVQPYLPVAERERALALLKAKGLRVILPWPDEPEQVPLEADLYLWETSPKTTGLLGGSGQGHGLVHPPPGPFLLGGGLSGPILGERLAAMPAAVRAACRGFDAASRLELPLVGGAFQGKARNLVQAFVHAAHSLPE